MNKWEHLFINGEFAERKKILSGLTFEQANYKPSAQSHSIYEELWHTTRWQHIIVMRDKALYEEGQMTTLYPDEPLTTEEEWQSLIKEFLSGLDKVIEITKSPENLSKEIVPNFTVNDALISLAVHNAYHLGKILAIRQMIGAWNPTG